MKGYPQKGKVALLDSCFRVYFCKIQPDSNWEIFGLLRTVFLYIARCVFGVDIKMKVENPIKIFFK